MIGPRMRGALVAAAGALALAPAANAATLSVDDDGVECPAAPYTHVQNAINAANPGDTVAICPGTYVEGNGGTGTNALTIAFKSLTIRGAGADLVAIQPKRTTPTGGTIADTNTSPPLNIRNGVGDIVSVIGSKTFPTTVDISGVTIDGNGVYVEAGIVYKDSGGTLARDRVTNVVTSEANTADTLAGGYRSAFPGIGVAQVTCSPLTAGTGGSCPTNPATTFPARSLTLDHTRVSRYNTIGVLVDTATNDTPPLTGAPNLTNSASLIGTQIVGRTQCTAFNTPTPPPYVLGGPSATPSNQLPGNCSSVGLTTVGPTFGQDGIRVTTGSTASIADTTISANLVHGTDAPAYNSTTNNANLSLGAGVRLIGAGASSIHTSNIVDNAYGVENVALDGTTANVATPVDATNDFWGLRTNATANTGPAISPTTNPPYQENPVNGTAIADPPGTTSDAVDFYPFRDGNQADPNRGEFPVAYAPLPQSDSGPSVTLSTNSPTYDRGDSVQLDATATDDFGIAKITFYDGAAQVGVAIPPAHTASFAIPAEAPCAERTLTAVAQDSIGQTASDTATITVVGPNNCEPVVPPAEPTIGLTGVPASIGAAGATVGAAVTVDPSLSVVKVEFALGNRTVCTDDAAPYACQILPDGGEVGSQTVRATVTDSGAQTAAAEAATVVERFTPTGLDVNAKKVPVKKSKRAKKKKKRTTARLVSGAVGLPERVSRAQGCSTGTVTLTIEKNGRTLFPLTQVPLESDCSYALRFTTKKTKHMKFRVEASFGGNEVLKPISNHRRFK